MDEGASQFGGLLHTGAECLDLPVALVLQPDVLEYLMSPSSGVGRVHAQKLAGIADLVDCGQPGVEGVVLRHVADPRANLVALSPDVVT